MNKNNKNKILLLLVLLSGGLLYYFRNKKKVEETNNKPIRSNPGGKYPYYFLDSFLDVKKLVYATDGITTSLQGPRWNKNHMGVDIGGGNNGKPIYSISDGTIKKIGGTGFGPYALLIEVDKDTMINKNFYPVLIWYGHNQKLAPNTYVGKKVKAGDLIAYVGSEGLSTGPHLHLEAYHTTTGFSKDYVIDLNPYFKPLSRKITAKTPFKK